MKLNPLFQFIREKEQIISTLFSYVHKNGYLLITNDSISEPLKLFKNAITIDRHLRIDEHTMILDEASGINPYSSNLCPAHYTERYYCEESQKHLVLHVYLNLKGDILKTVIKDEDTGLTDEHLSESQKETARHSAQWGIDQLNELIAKRDQYLFDISQSANLEILTDLIYQELQSKQLSRARQKIEAILPILQQNDLFAHGVITAQTRFLERVVQTEQSRRPEQDPHEKVGNSAFSIFALDETDVHEEISETDQASNDLPPTLSPEEQKAQAIIARRKEVEQYFSDLEAKLHVYRQTNELAFAEYHDRYLDLLQHHFLLECDQTELNPEQRSLFEQSNQTLNDYKNPKEQLLSLALEGDIQNLNHAIDYMGGSADILVRALFIVIIHDLKSISDDNFSRLIEYVLTCDKFTGAKTIFTDELRVSLSIGKSGKQMSLINIKQLLIPVKYTTSFITLCKLLPNDMILGSSCDLNTLRMLSQAALNDEKIILKYLDSGGATSTFRQNLKQYILREQDLQTAPKLKFHKLSEGEIKKAARQFHTRQAEVDTQSYIANSRTILLKELYDQKHLKQIIKNDQKHLKQILKTTTSDLEPDLEESKLQDIAMKTLSLKYWVETGNLHTLLQAVYCLTSYQSIIKRNIQFCIPSIGYSINSDHFHLELNDRCEQLERSQYPLDCFPKIFTYTSWIPNKPDSDLLLFMDLCTELLMNETKITNIDKVLSELNNPDMLPELLAFYEPYAILTAFQMAAELKKIIIINKVYPVFTQYNAAIRALAKGEKDIVNHKNFTQLSTEELEQLCSSLQQLERPTKEVISFALKHQSQFQTSITNVQKLTNLDRLHKSICDISSPSSMIYQLRELSKMIRNLNSLISQRKEVCKTTGADLVSSCDKGTQPT